MKKRGFGEGKYNGAGGKIEGGETILAGARRELEEETGVKVGEEKFENRGLFHYFFENRPDWDQDVTLFVVKDYSGEIFETEEMRPEWFKIDKIPYDKMWEDDSIWLPRILNCETVEYSFRFNEDGKILSYNAIK
ncbi:8-oxo-dGTP diphosphatase [Candidatus Gracilibacteria bacterium]|nr:8-oxo-dGTP diphosphatase [Candidatus Gracilibacteria bacterium]